MSVNVSLSPWCWTVSRAAAVSQTTSEKDDSRSVEIDISCSFFSSFQVMWPLESNSVLVGWDTPLFIGFWFLPITDATFEAWQLSGPGSSRLSSRLSIKARNLCLSGYLCFKFLCGSGSDWPESFNMTAACCVQRRNCLDYNDTVNKLFNKCFTNSTSIVNHSHVHTRANHCRAQAHDTPYKTSRFIPARAQGTRILPGVRSRSVHPHRNTNWNLNLDVRV